MNIQLLAIDPQNDFCDQPGAALPVPGATGDLDRLATMIDRLGPKLDDIHVTLDSHGTHHIAHPNLWINSKGEHPELYSVLSEDSVVSGEWSLIFSDHDLRQRAIDYVKALKVNDRYELRIWPPHCRIGTWGTSVYPNLMDALIRWEENETANVDYVTKGSNMMTEHYSAVKADVPDLEDETTLLNTDLIEILQTSDDVLVGGEALQFCVASTVRDVADEFGEDNISKFVLLEDCSSNVAGSEFLGEQFVNEMVARGMRVTTSVDYLA